MKRKKIEIEGEVEPLEIMPLGSGTEVGRSCLLLKFKGKTVMFDCGVHPAMSGLQQLPFFDYLKEENINVDVCLVTHFHVDHSGAVPFFANKTDYKGKIWMTHPTKSICRMLWSDMAKVNKIQDDQIYTLRDVDQACKRIELIDFHQELEVNGIRFTCYSAGHVLGACMFLVEIGGIRVLYTGDYSREIDRHLTPAEVPPMRVHVLISESTYGTQNHMSREEREARFLSKVLR
jgi:cleavage and polyadenylation specificity factor subunit 3